MFFQAYSKDEAIKVWDPTFGADVLPEDFIRISNDKLQKAKAVFGHLPVVTFLGHSVAQKRFQSGEFQIVSTVRDPIDRIISLYNYVKVNAEHPGNKAMMSIDPVEFIRKQKINFQFEFLQSNLTPNVDDMLEKLKLFKVSSSIENLIPIISEDTGRLLTTPKKANVTAERNVDNIELFNKNMLNNEIMK